MDLQSFDDVFTHAGGFGPYQYIIFGVVCFFTVLFGFIYYGQIFMSLTPPHWCSPPPNFKADMWLNYGLNLTQEQVVKYTIPRTADGLGYEKCLRYDVNFTETFLEGQRPDGSWPTASCTYGWDYNYTIYYPTITSQMNWVCDEDWKLPSAQTFFFIGSMIGVPLFGWLADYFGRLPIIVATNLIGGIFGIASSFSSSFIAFCAFRFIVGLAYDSNFTIMYILGLEYVSAPYRSIVANIPILIFLTAAMCSLPWIAYALRDWSMFGLAIHAPLLLSVIVIWLAPESARWLIGKGKSEKAWNIVEKMAKLNKKDLGKEFESKFQVYAKQAYMETKEQKVTWLDLLKTPILRKRFLLLCVMWIAIFLAYDGHVRHTENIGPNIFVTFTLMGAVEFPADFFTILFMEWVGRRHTTVWTLIISGIVAVGIVAVPKADAWTIVGLAVTGRFFITMSINVGLQYIMEVLPTMGRAQGSGAIHSLGMGMAFVSPYIVYLSKFSHWIPYVIFGCVSIFGGLLTMLLPETLGENLPDSLKDGEEYFSGQALCYNPCRKKKQDEPPIQVTLEGIQNEAFQEDSTNL